MKKKPKKKWIVLSIILAVLLLLAAVGYYLVNMAFSIFTDSFYSAVVPSELPKEVTEILTPKGEESPQDPADEREGTTTSSSGQKNNTGGGVLFSSKTIKDLEKKVAFSDKVAVLNILSAGLSGADYRALIGMLNNGVTGGEVSKAYQILKENLSRPDKDKIMGYYYKYAHLIQ